MTETCSNYFTEIEEHFRRARGTPLFRLSPLDWALIEAWQNGGIPLEAVLRGIDVTFKKRRRRPAQAKIGMVNSLAYCSQAIVAEAQAIVNATERLEQRLATIEETLIANLRIAASGYMLREMRCELERQLKPYRSKMTVEQIAMLERQFFDRRLLESAGLPRLSLFYLA